MALAAQDIDSTAFTQIMYDDEKQIAIVLFKDGGRFTYRIPQDVMDQWVQADSAGAFYNRNIRGQFSFFVD